MHYTIIGKSGWQGDGWQVVETMTNKRDAMDKARSLRQVNPRYTNYQMDVKGHRKSLAEMANLDNFTVSFSDGTVAMLDQSDYFEAS